MPFYLHHIYPRLIGGLGDPHPIRDIRRQIIPRAEGIVLEIGVGTGANFALIFFELTRSPDPRVQRW